MEKLKTICRWVGVDGLLYFLVCYGMMLAFTPVVGVWWAMFSVAVACGFGTFWAVCGAIGTRTAVLIFAWEAWGEWQEKDNYGD